MDFDDLHDLADDRPNDRPELSSPIENDGGDEDDPGSDMMNMPVNMGMEGSAPGTRLRGEQRYHSLGNKIYLEHACHECGEAREAEGKRDL